MQSSELPFAGKVAIVTGAASGIGLATAELLLKQGAQVVAEDINPKIKKQFAGRKNVVSLVADVGTEKAAVDAVNLAQDQFGKLDILVNNAGRIVYKPAVEMTLHDWKTIMDVTSTGVFLHSRESLKAMIAHKSGAMSTLVLTPVTRHSQASAPMPQRKVHSHRSHVPSPWKLLSMGYA